jgi:hypothetical protein
MSRVVADLSARLEAIEQRSVPATAADLDNVGGRPLRWRFVPAV